MTRSGATWRRHAGVPRSGISGIAPRAGLKVEDIPVGTKVIVEGNRPRKSDALLLRPRRIIIVDEVYEFRGSWN